MSFADEKAALISTLNQALTQANALTQDVTPPIPPIPPIPPTPPTGLGLGVYSGAANLSGDQQFASETATDIGIIGDYTNGSTFQSIEEYDVSWLPSTYQLELAVNTVPDTMAVKNPSGGYKPASSIIANGAAGQYNSHYATLAKTLVFGNHADSIIDLCREWDGFWEPHYVNSQADAVNLAKYQNQIISTMMAVPGAAFVFPFYVGRGGDSICVAADPNSTHTDSGTMDFYDSAAWSSIVGNLTNLFIYCHSKNRPVRIGECGLRDMGDDPAWVRNFIAWCKANDVISINYFNFNSGGNSVLSSYPKSLAQWKSLLGS